MPHRLGQVFLTDRNIVSKIVNTVRDHCDAKNSQLIEVGCGSGNLSVALAPICDRFIIIERDRLCLDQTKIRLSHYDHIDYRHADVLKCQPDTLLSNQSNQSNQYHWVSNLPYYISAKFMQKLVAERSYWSHATLMLQHEFAKKLVAGPGDPLYSALGLYCQYYLDIRYAFSVSNTCFSPVPSVQSAVITCRPRQHLMTVDQDILFSIIRSAFWGRRKPLVSALKKSPFFQWQPEYMTLLPYQTLGSKRGETLTLAMFCELARAIQV